jgi:hypothetical protein
MEEGRKKEGRDEPRRKEVGFIVFLFFCFFFFLRASFVCFRVCSGAGIKIKIYLPVHYDSSYVRWTSVEMVTFSDVL